jgi:hypothetical protein
MATVKKLLGSKRVIAAMGGIAFVLFKDKIPGITVTEDQAVYVVGLIASWIVGDSIRPLPEDKPDAAPPA